MSAVDLVSPAVADSERSTWRAAYYLVVAWLIVELTIWVLAWAIGSFATPDRAWLSLPRSPVDVLSTWDGGHYATIARYGYSTVGAEAREFSFFPLLPIVSRLLGGAEHAVLAGILLNQLCLLVSILLIGKLVEDGRPAQLFREPGFWMLVTPVGFFFSVYYAESLLLLFSLLLVIAYQRKRIGWACLAGVLAGLTRPTAVCLPALFLPDLIGRLRRREPLIGTLACAAAPLVGIVLYLSYVGWRNADPLAYIHLRNHWWTHAWTLPFQPLLDDLRRFPIEWRWERWEWMWVRLASSVCILALIVWGWRKIDPAFSTYLVIAFLFIHSQEPATGTARFELVLFPVFLLLSRLMAGRPILAWTFACLCIAAQVFYFYLFATWIWVA